MKSRPKIAKRKATAKVAPASNKRRLGKGKSGSPSHSPVKIKVKVTPLPRVKGERKPRAQPKPKRKRVLPARLPIRRPSRGRSRSPFLQFLDDPRRLSPRAKRRWVALVEVAYTYAGRTDKRTVHVSIGYHTKAGVRRLASDDIVRLVQLTAATDAEVLSIQAIAPLKPRKKRKGKTLEARKRKRKHVYHRSKNRFR